MLRRLAYDGRSGASVHGGDETRRAVVYCVVPRDLSPAHEALRAHFSDDPSVTVVVEQRAADRRRGADRRAADSPASPPGAGERRRVRNAAGRRVGERRASQIPVTAPELPRRLRRHAARIAFVERLEPASEHLEDLDTARVVIRFQAGDRDAFGLLYMRYFDRVYSYLKLVLRDVHEAEDATQHVFEKTLGALARYERRAQPFRAWLFTIVRNEGMSVLARNRRTDVVDADDIRRDIEVHGGQEIELEMLGWLSDQELLLFVERLPLVQRQVVVLRYMLGLSMSEIGELLGRNSNSVRQLHHRALAVLRARLSALGRGPKQGGPIGSRRWVGKAPVLRARRYALVR